MSPADLYQAGRFEEALSACLEISGQDPSNWENWNDLEVVLFALGKLDEAVKCLSPAVAGGCADAKQNLKHVTDRLEAEKRSSDES